MGINYSLITISNLTLLMTILFLISVIIDQKINNNMSKLARNTAIIIFLITLIFFINKFKD